MRSGSCSACIVGASGGTPMMTSMRLGAFRILTLLGNPILQRAGLSLSLPPSVSEITRLVTSETFIYNPEHTGLKLVRRPTAGQTRFDDASGTLCKCVGARAQLSVFSAPRTNVNMRKNARPPRHPSPNAQEYKDSHRSLENIVRKGMSCCPRPPPEDQIGSCSKPKFMVEVVALLRHHLYQVCFR